MQNRDPRQLSMTEQLCIYCKCIVLCTADEQADNSTGIQLVPEVELSIHFFYASYEPINVVQLLHLLQPQALILQSSLLQSRTRNSNICCHFVNAEKSFAVIRCTHANQQTGHNRKYETNFHFNVAFLVFSRQRAEND